MIFQISSKATICKLNFVALTTRSTKFKNLIEKLKKKVFVFSFYTVKITLNYFFLKTEESSVKCENKWMLIANKIHIFDEPHLNYPLKAENRNLYSYDVKERVCVADDC